MDMHTYTQTKEQTGQHGQEHMDTYTKWTGVRTWAHMHSRSYLDKDLDKTELTPALLVVPTPCRWNTEKI